MEQQDEIGEFCKLVQQCSENKGTRFLDSTPSVGQVMREAMRGVDSLKQFADCEKCDIDNIPCDDVEAISKAISSAKAEEDERVLRFCRNRKCIRKILLPSCPHICTKFCRRSNCYHQSYQHANHGLHCQHKCYNMCKPKCHHACDNECDIYRPYRPAEVLCHSMYKKNEKLEDLTEEMSKIKDTNDQLNKALQQIVNNSQSQKTKILMPCGCSWEV